MGRRAFPAAGGTTSDLGESNLERYAALAHVVTDADAGAAPDALLAGFHCAHTDWIAIVPCDAPHLPADLVDRLAGAVGTADAACVRVDGGLQPMFASASLQKHFAAGGRAMHGWLESLAAVAAEFDDDAPFRNINSAEDSEGRAA